MINVEVFKQALPIIGWAALGTFLVIGVIIGCTVLLNVLTRKKKKKDGTEQ